MNFPAIREFIRTGDSARIVFVARADLSYFKGHFPGFPVLPGVVQIGWARAFADDVFGGRHTVTGMRRIKFMRLIRPDTAVTLELHRRGDRLEFHYHDTDGSYSSGTLEVTST